MDPNNRGPEEHGRDDDGLDAQGDSGGTPRRPPRDALTAAFATAERDGDKGSGPAKTVQLVAAEYLLTVNPVDGSEIEPCPPGEHPGRPERRNPEERDALRRASRPPVPAGPPVPELPLLEREEERERLVRLLSRGRSVRLTGPSGSGRTTLLDAVAADCAGLAPDGLVRLSGHHRTPTDLLHELFTTVHRAPLHRPARAELLAAVGGIGAVVVLDDVEFGGSALDELLDATPECAFLISATPDVPSPSATSHLEEVFLAGLSRTGCVELLAKAAGRPLDEDETAWAADLWFESEGLPLRFIQAGALLRQRDALRAEFDASDEHGAFEDRPRDPSFDEDRQDFRLPSLAEAAAPVALIASRLSEAARESLRFAVAFGGECPHQSHLPALVGDTHADAAVGELLACGLITRVAAHYRLAAGAAAQLVTAGYADDAAARAHTAAQHYAWWIGHSSVTPERAAAESDAILAALGSLVGHAEGGRASTAVLLARTAAPVFAAALTWSVWERTLRHGQEAARVAGEVAQEAYFHHELGVLALCTGHLDRARAELEASIGLRGALSDRRGTVAGRRALALVEDKAGGFVPGVGRAAAGEEVPDAQGDASVSPPGGVTAVLPQSLRRGGTGGDEAATVVTIPDSLQRGWHGQDGPGRGGGSGKLAGMRRTVVGGARRNMVAAGAGALLVAVLGAVVTLGASSDGEDRPADRVQSEQSDNEDDGSNGLIADEPTQSATQRSQKPSVSRAPGTPGLPQPGDSDTGKPSPTGKPSSSKPGTPDETSKPPSSSKPPSTTKPPSSSPSSSPPPSSSPTGIPTPTSDPGGDTSTTASGPAPSSPAGSDPAVSSAPGSYSAPASYSTPGSYGATDAGVAPAPVA
ncbi:ATP-binding protein [Streptomyces sp. KR80]|uniref:ATP-binding protein n=1 Tax=Streptomyces sp. KR80 TaxID=3457426 RepID=UPI003FD69E76